MNGKDQRAAAPRTAAHSAGPWSISPHSMNASAQTEIVSGPHGTHRIATLSICESEHANAKLVAAAPDLLSTAKALIILLAPDLHLLTETTRNAVSALCGAVEKAGS